MFDEKWQRGRDDDVDRQTDRIGSQSGLQQAALLLLLLLIHNKSPHHHRRASRDDNEDILLGLYGYILIDYAAGLDSNGSSS